MPKRKGYNMVQARMLAMRAAKTRKKEISSAYKSVESPAKNTIRRELSALERGERNQVRPSENKDSGNRIVHWDSL